jgi:hypothetical protein
MEHLCHYPDSRKLTYYEENSFVHNKPHTTNKPMARLTKFFGWLRLFHLYQLMAKVYIMGGFF